MQRTRRWWQIFGTRSQTLQTLTRWLITFTFSIIEIVWQSEYSLSLSHILNNCTQWIITFSFWYIENFDKVRNHFHFIRHYRDFDKLNIVASITFTFICNNFVVSRTVRSTLRSLWGAWKLPARERSMFSHLTTSVFVLSSILFLWVLKGISFNSVVRI